MTINTRVMELIGVFQNYFFWVNYNVSIWEWDWVKEKTFDHCMGIKYFAILRLIWLIDFKLNTRDL